MNRALAGAGVVVLAANAVALIGAARNRWSTPDAVMELSEQELRLESGGTENSGMSLGIGWVWQSAYEWLQPPVLADLGFRLPGSDTRILPRPGYIAVELNAEGGAPRPLGSYLRKVSQLVPVDAASDPVRLRARHPDRGKTLILPALFRAYRSGPGGALKGESANLITTSIAVPPQYRELFTTLRPAYPAEYPRYAVRLAVGRNYEPYIAGVRKLTQPSPAPAPAP